MKNSLFGLQFPPCILKTRHFTAETYYARHCADFKHKTSQYVMSKTNAVLFLAESLVRSPFLFIGCYLHGLAIAHDLPLFSNANLLRFLLYMGMYDIYCRCGKSKCFFHRPCSFDVAGLFVAPRRSCAGRPGSVLGAFLGPVAPAGPHPLPEAASRHKKAAFRRRTLRLHESRGIKSWIGPHSPRRRL